MNLDLSLAQRSLKKQTGLYQYEREKINCDLSRAGMRELVRTYLHADASIVLWQMQNICWGRWEDEEMILADGSILQPEYLQEIRFFNETEELRLFRQGNGFIGRYIIDQGVQESVYIDSFSRFWGENDGKAESDGFVTLRDESRQLWLRVPCSTADSRYYGLITRNYISADPDTGQAGYTDYRFVKIASADGGR